MREREHYNFGKQNLQSRVRSPRAISIKDLKVEGKANIFFIEEGKFSIDISAIRRVSEDAEKSR